MKTFLWYGLMAVVGIAVGGEAGKAEEKAVPLDMLPKVVLKSVKDKYPTAELTEATQEGEGDDLKFEVLIEDGKTKIDLTVTPAGVIELIEKEVATADLPKVVIEAIEKKYPKSLLKTAEAVFEVENGKEELEFYEVRIETAAKELMEVKINEKGEFEDDKKANVAQSEDEWTSDFSADKADLTTTGKNPYFILEPGYQLFLEGGDETLTITVLNETKLVDGVETRVVEERETKNGKLVEVSRNYFAISKRTNNVYYFGEDVDNYKGGKVSDHRGSWQSGVNNAKFGLAMQGFPLLDAKYQQEVAPGVALDRAEIDSVSETVKVPAGEFKNCLKIEESTPLEPGEEEVKLYAPNVGLLTESSMKLVRYGKVELKK